MSVLIKGMNMPENCLWCQFHGFAGYKNESIVCSLTGQSEEQLSNVPNCPIVEVPTPHGDLIDRWKLTETAMIDPDEGKYVAVYRADEVDEAPVVIEAEE